METQQNSRRGSVHFASEMLRFYVSSVIFAMNGAFKYYKNIKTYVLRCTIIGFKQKYGHRSSRRADMNPRCKSEFSTAEIGQYLVGVADHEIVLFDAIPVRIFK